MFMPRRTERRPARWLELLQGPTEHAMRYLKSHGLAARDVMTPKPLTVSENTPLEKVAALLEQNRIKRVPVVRGGKLVGIVSRADLLRAPPPRSCCSPSGSPARSCSGPPPCSTRRPSRRSS